MEAENETEESEMETKMEAENETEESEMETKCDATNEAGETQQSEIKSTKETVMPELTLVLIGDADSIEIGSKTILLDHDKPTHAEQFSSKLYDFCGRHISVINMLGLGHIDKFPISNGVHAFLLLLTNGLHDSHYSSGVQWLGQAFGEGSLAYLMTVVTYEAHENSDSALTDLKTKSRFDEKRYHTCQKSMTDANEILDLLDKIDVMVSENDPRCYNGVMSENKEQKEHLDIKPHEEEHSDPPVIWQKQTGTLHMDMSENKDQQSMKLSEEISRNQQSQREFETLLGRLHLQDKHQQKLTTADFLQIGPPLKQDHETCEKDLAHTFLQRLMMLDYRARYIPVKEHSQEICMSNLVPESDTNEINMFQAFLNTNVNSDQSKQSTLHPMDVQMAAFHCSDSFFKQNMVTKLSQCQYAVPLLVLNPVTMDIECPLWTFRKIKKTWKVTETKDNSDKVIMKSMPICKAETPMVSFFRLGSLSVSKSHLMNTLINNRHNTFFHRNCPGSTKSCHLVDGVAEIAWYCPAGKSNDAFTECIAFCNLHGDALLFGKQRDILIEKSSVSVVLVPTLKTDDKGIAVISALLNSQRPIVLLIADSDCEAVQITVGKYKFGLKDRSEAVVSEELKKIIGNILSGTHTSFQLESMAEVSGIRVDEEDPVCQKGKSAAMKVTDVLQDTEVSTLKAQFLPCQGQLWHDWCKTKKELYHLKGQIENEKCEKEDELMRIRRDQCSCSTKLIRPFIESLSALESVDRDYFLKWTQIFIDDLSTDDLTSILQSYDKKWSEVLTLKNKHDKSAQLKEKEAELDQISAKLQSATFGLEHIFREMGQIYEAHKSLKKRPGKGPSDWSKYPKMAAELMLSGHPMELMDGDAGHVPSTWISSLLDEVIRKLGDRKIFVLSVLGIQSSGKSTMLNAMFGLQFAVSAGRCTKGAYMQLVKVSEEIQKDYEFDYILVVDTEGLRALELAGNATLHHDNELATFVIGLGNLTLINIFGENPAEMQDVLQIVVQAFMRMKKVKLNPGCVFVHQNVTDIAAKEKNMDGKRRLQEKLDQMAQLAAKEEESDAECFTDVIAFDVQQDVKYFAQLWEGSPPMAPPNPGYSESVQELKKTILSKASQSSVITLSQFKGKIQDLWNALLNENFVFSFKNTLEIAVYRKLEVQYGKWTWTLRSQLLDIERQLYTRIQNGELAKIDSNSLFEKMKPTYEKIQKDIEGYFNDKRDKEVLVQWRGRFEIDIKDIYVKQVEGVKRKLDEVIQQKTACKNLDDKKKEFESKMLQKSKDLARELKDKVKDEKELKKQFDSVWSHWVSELTEGTKPIEEINLEQDQMSLLRVLGFESNLIDECKQSGRFKNISQAGSYIDYIHQTKSRDPTNESQQSQQRKTAKKGKRQQGGDLFKDGLNVVKDGWNAFTQWFSKDHFPYEQEEKIRSLIREVLKHSLDVIGTKTVAVTGYSNAYLHDVANIVQTEVAEFLSAQTYSLKKEFVVDVLLYVFDQAGDSLSESHQKFKMNNDAHAYVESKKGQYYNIFRSFCKGSSSAVVFGELICEKLNSSIVETVCNKTAISLASELKCSFPAFRENRLNLEKHVLMSLAEKEDFKDFITYIRHPKKQVETFIKEEVQKNIFTKNRSEALKTLRRNVADISEIVNQALFDATEKVKNSKTDLDTPGHVDMWVEEFSTLLKNELTFSVCCENFHDINNFDFLKEEINKGLDHNIKKMNDLPLEKIKEFRMKPDQILIEQLCKCCWVKCPFCAAVCTNTIEDHTPDDHCVPFHRSGAVKGFHYRGTDQMSVDFCTTNLASDRRFYPHWDSNQLIAFKLYRTAGPQFANWRITPDESKLKYWTWFVCRFQKELESHYQLKFHKRGEIPAGWKKHTKVEAIQSLDEMYKVD